MTLAMDRESLISELEVIIGNYLKEKNLDLVELTYRFEGQGLVLRILTDRPEGGISLGDCFSLNREIGAFLDEKNILQDRYILEVSSPGLDRPLRNKNDFFRCRNKMVQFFLKEPIGGKLEWAGKISSVDEEAVKIEQGGREILLPLEKIIKGKQVI